MKLQDEAMFRPEGESLDDVLADLNVKEDSPLPESEQAEKEISTDSPAEKNQEEDTQSSEGDKKEEGTKEPAAEDTQDAKDEPFHKRWKERQDKLKADFQNDLQTALATQKAEFEEKLKEFRPVDGVTQYPEFVRNIYGENSQEGMAFYRNFLREQETFKERIKSDLIAEQQQQVQKAKQDAERWQGWVGDQLQELKDEGLKFSDNELQKVALDYMPTDEEGNISFRKAYDILKTMKAAEADPERSKARKEIAAMTTDSKTAVTETKPKTYQTPETLRNVSWNQLASSD